MWAKERSKDFLRRMGQHESEPEGCGVKTMLGFSNYLPRRPPTVLTELACLVITGALAVLVITAYGIVKVGEWLKGKL